MRSITVTALSLSVVTSIQCLSTSAALSQTLDICSPYGVAITGGVGGSVPVIPDPLLKNWKYALACLIPTVGSLEDAIKSNPVSAETRSKFLSVTGAIRGIVTKISAAEEADKLLPAAQRNPNIEKVSDFVDEFQKYLTVDVASVLTYGARSDSYDMRLNSVLILSNVLDERQICVPLVHLYDPNLDSKDYGINGRANLLAMLYRAAPWAYFEDFRNITNARAYIAGKINRDDPDLAGTNKLLDGIVTRLALQNDRTNKSVHLPEKYKEDCRAYIKAFPATNEATTNLRYE